MGNVTITVLTQVAHRKDEKLQYQRQRIFDYRMLHFVNRKRGF